MTTLGFSMELASGALTRLEGMDVAAACRLGAAVYCAGDTGFFRVGGDSDDGAPIAARLSLPVTDGGEAAPKRLPAVCLEGLVAGRVEVVATSEAGASLEGEIKARPETGLPGRTAVKLPRGLGRFWQVSLASPDGALRDLGAVTLELLPLDRRPL